MHDRPAIDRFVDLMRLEPHGPDVFVGLSLTYPWGRVYGGQVVAQALRAAMLTVDAAYATHSLHAYFIRGGTAEEPIRFEVDRIRNGRSFCTRRVVARQSGGAILNLSASFHVEEHGPDVQTPVLPDVPAPGDLEPDDWTPLLECRQVPPGTLAGRQARWIRVAGSLGDDPADHQLALLFASDDVPYDAAARIRPDHTDESGGEGERPFVGASLDHAVWFHRHGHADDWQLHVLEGLAHTGNRGLAFGQVFGADGTHLASVGQEIVHRRNTRLGSG